MGFRFKLAPGIRVSTRGVRIGPRVANVRVGRGGAGVSVGPRAARVHVGTRGVGVSSGVGPAVRQDDGLYFPGHHGGVRRQSSFPAATASLAAIIAFSSSGLSRTISLFWWLKML